MQKWILAKWTIAALAIASSASAQGVAPEFGAQGQLAISAERLFGVYYARRVDNPPGPGGGDNLHSSTVIGFGWNYTPSSFVQPRAGLDYFVVNHLSLGGAIGLFSGAGHQPQVGETGFIIAPRVGYAIDLGRVASFWPRGGMTYYSHGDWHNIALTGEANFALFPRANWAFLITPFFDVGPFGRVNDVDFTELALGVSFGLMGVI